MLMRLLLVFALALPGCAAWDAYAQRKAIERAQFSLRGVQLTGLDLVGANLLVTLQLENPTETPIVLDRLDYALFVNGARAIEGKVAERLSVPPGQSKALPIAVSVAYADVGTQVRGLIAQGQVTTWKLTGMAHFDTPFGTIDYPIELERKR